MSTKIVYTNKAIKDLKRLGKPVAQKIVEKIEYYSQQKDPLQYAKKLKPPFDDLYRFRVSDYRAVFEVDAKGNILLLTILTIRHRKDIYE